MQSSTFCGTIAALILIGWFFICLGTAGKSMTLVSEHPDCKDILSDYYIPVQVAILSIILIVTLCSLCMLGLGNLCSLSLQTDFRTLFPTAGDNFATCFLAFAACVSIFFFGWQGVGIGLVVAFPSECASRPQAFASAIISATGMLVAFIGAGCVWCKICKV